MRKLALFLILTAGAVVAAMVYYSRDGEGEQSEFTFAKVERGTIVNLVSSTGTLNSLVTVQVGSQVSGQIKELLVDFNSEVRQDQVIALIDPVNFEARVRQYEAELAVSRANVAIQSAAVERGRAELENARSAAAAASAKTEKARVALSDAKRDRDRKENLHKQSIISDSQFDEAVAAYDQAMAQMRATEAEEKAQYSVVRSRKAALKMAQAQVEHASAQVKQKEAALHQSKVDLEHTIIRSPVDGVVIGRSVDIGQTVAASLQAPTLFTIAQDLREMQVDTSVDEADIGHIQMSQRATFTVDAFPGREFKGQVIQIRKQPETVQNVVTYTVVVSAENSNLLLLPGMTANVQIAVDERSDVLKVPNGALRFTPPGNKSGPDEASGSSASGTSEGLGEQQRMALIKRLTNSLELTEEQQAKLHDIFARGREQIMALRTGGATSEEIRSEVQRMRQDSRGAIIAMLTPEQRRKYREMEVRRAKRQVSPGRVWVVNRNGKLVPVNIMTGISDGNFTEIVRGDLEAGQEVVIGARQSDRRPSQSGRRRLRF
ncbi:MAG: efflux RND transporter periplasmic adaptor subunit [Desulfobacteraceae bacterium]|nr:MAG: efflux RND transporter periplasmic adaptor subunit [Desulfobacteraceae bacterium]